MRGLKRGGISFLLDDFDHPNQYYFVIDSSLQYLQRGSNWNKLVDSVFEGEEKCLFQQLPDEQKKALSDFTQSSKSSFTGELLLNNYHFSIFIKRIDANEFLGQLTLTALSRSVVNNKFRQKILTDLTTNKPSDRIFELSIESEELHISEQYSELLGYSSEEVDFYASNWQSLIHPEDAERVLSLLDALKQSNDENFKFEFRAKHKNGDWLELIANGIAIRNNSNQLTSVVGSIEDVTQDRRVKRLLEQSEKNFRQIFESITDVYFRINEHGEIKMISPSVKDVFEFEPSEVYSKKIRDFFYDQSAIEWIYAELLKNGRVSNIENRTTTKTGKVVYSTTNLSVIYDEAGAFRGMEGLIRDTSALYQERKSRIHSEERYRILSELTTEGILIHDKGVAMDVNQSFANLLGYTVEELKNKDIVNLVVPVEYHGQLVEKLKQKKTLLYQMQLRTKSGTFVDVEIESREIEYFKRSARVSVVRDITNKKRDELKIKQQDFVIQKIMASAGSKVGEDFFHSITKELTELLGAYQSFVGIYKDDEKKVAAIANYKDAKKSRLFEYDTFDTPCENTLNEGIYCIEKNLRATYKNNLYLRENEINGYLGIPLYNRHGAKIGVMVSLFQDDIQNIALAKTIQQIFSARVAAELERKLSLDALKESELRFRTLIEALNGVFWVKNLYQNKIEYVSPRYEQVYGLPVQTFIENSSEFHGIVHPDDADDVMEDYHNASFSMPSDFNYRIIKDDEIRHIRSRSIFFQTDENNNTREYGYAEDVTESIKAENEIRKLALVARTTNNAVLILNAHGKVEWLNDSYQRITGIKPASVMDKGITHCLNLSRIDEQVLKEIALAMSDEKEYSKELEIVKKSFEVYWVHLTLNPIHDLKGEVERFIVIITDINEAKQHEQAIEHQNLQLMKTNQELDNFVYRVSHDLKAPISSTRGLINLARMEQEPERVFQCIDLMEESMKRLEGFILDILDYSRNSRLRISAEKIEFCPLIDQIFQDMAFLHNYNDIKRTCRVVGDVDFYSDYHRITFMLSNLLSNAIRFSDAEKPNQFIGVNIEVLEDHAIVKIADNGIGIAPEHLDFIFNMFYRATEHTEGSGLGLYIVKESADKLSAEIEVNSALHEGTTFTLKIPNLKTPKTAQVD